MHRTPTSYGPERRSLVWRRTTALRHRHGVRAESGCVSAVHVKDGQNKLTPTY